MKLGPRKPGAVLGDNRKISTEKVQRELTPRVMQHRQPAKGMLSGER
jgi:hypothetical protein